VDHLLELAAPEVVDRLEVTGKSHEVLWALENRRAIPVQAVDYGIVPEGFVQVVPVTGSAPSLERGIRVRLSDFAAGESATCSVE